MPQEKRKRADAVKKAFFFEGQNSLQDVGTWKPNIDLCETSEGVSVKVDLPGVRGEDVVVSISGNTLRVRGIKRETQMEQRYVCYLCLERSYGRFYREVKLHWMIDAQGAKATLKEGILLIQIPKIEDRRGKEYAIPIECE